VPFFDRTQSSPIPVLREPLQRSEANARRVLTANGITRKSPYACLLLTMVFPHARTVEVTLMGHETEVRTFDSSSRSSLFRNFRTKSIGIHDRLDDLGYAWKMLNERIRSGESLHAILTVDGYRIGEYKLFNHCSGIEELIMTLDGRLIE